MPTLKYQIDAYHAEWRCGLEVEAGRAWMGNAVYRDLIQALIMVQVDHLVLAVPNAYKYKTSGRSVSSTDYASTVAVATALYGHTACGDRVLSGGGLSGSVGHWGHAHERTYHYDVRFVVKAVDQPLTSSTGICSSSRVPC